MFSLFTIVIPLASRPAAELVVPEKSGIVLDYPEAGVDV
jgi:hypothetical protein